MAKEMERQSLCALVVLLGEEGEATEEPQRMKSRLSSFNRLQISSPRKGSWKL